MEGELTCYIRPIIIKNILEEQRSVSQLFRSGGDEFYILFRQKSGQEVYAYMDYITHEVADNFFVYEEEKIQVTLSSGIGEAKEGESPKVF